MEVRQQDVQYSLLCYLHKQAKKEMPMRIITSLTMVVLLGGCSDDGSNSDHDDFPLVSVNVKDTPFNRPPDSVTILAKSPQTVFSSLASMKTPSESRLFQAKGIFYFVESVDFHNERMGTSFTDGDVVYIYNCDSLLAEAQLLGGHNFTRVNDPEEYHGLYRIHPHLFVRVGTNRDIQQFTCSMHPLVEVPQKSNCPICDMNLIGVSAEDQSPASLKLVNDTAWLY